MNTIFVFVAFFILAGITAYSAMQLSDSSEKFEKYSNLPPIIIGAILAVATSLPELATSLTSSLVVGDPITSVSNPIGSNMFNFVILAILNITFYKKTINYYLKNNNNIFNTIVIIMYLLTFIVAANPNLPYVSVGHINLITIFIILLYVLGLKMSSDNDDETTQQEKNPLELKKAIIRFAIFSVVVLVSSYFLSLVAEEIINITGLKSGFVGAVFLGIATSLPELISSFILCKHGNYNIACSNIVGSNMFNFVIVAVNDVFNKTPIWSKADGSVYPLFFYGFVLSIIMFLMIKFKTKNKVLNIILPVVTILIYIFYMITSA